MGAVPPWSGSLPTFQGGCSGDVTAPVPSRELSQAKRRTAIGAGKRSSSSLERERCVNFQSMPSKPPQRPKRQTRPTSGLKANRAVVSPPRPASPSAKPPRPRKQGAARAARKIAEQETTGTADAAGDDGAGSSPTMRSSAPRENRAHDTIPVQPEWLEIVDDDSSASAPRAEPLLLPGAGGRALGPPPLPGSEIEVVGARSSRPPRSKKSTRPGKHET